jgi:hypothetical protein
MNAVTPTGAAKQPPYDFKAYEEMDTGNFPDDDDLISQPGKPEAVSAMLDQFLIQAEGRGKAMDNESMDKVNSVIDKLETLSNLFEFYWFAREKTRFNKDSINGLCLIIYNCIAELREAVK